MLTVLCSMFSIREKVHIEFWSVVQIGYWSEYLQQHIDYRQPFNLFHCLSQGNDFGIITCHLS